MVTPRSGFDLEYYLGRAGEKTAGGYYLIAAQEGEPPGRWFGKGAEALGLTDGQVVDQTATCLAAGRDLLYTHFTPGPHGSRSHNPLWALAIPSERINRALLAELSGLAQQIARHGANIALTPASGAFSRAGPGAGTERHLPMAVGLRRSHPGRLPCPARPRRRPGPARRPPRQRHARPPRPRPGGERQGQQRWRRPATCRAGLGSG